MAAEKVDGVDESVVEATGPAHPRRPRAAFRHDRRVSGRQDEPRPHRHLAARDVLQVMAVAAEEARRGRRQPHKPGRRCLLPLMEAHRSMTLVVVEREGTAPQESVIPAALFSLVLVLVLVGVYIDWSPVDRRGRKTKI